VEAYWLLEGSKKPWNAHYQLAGLQEILPQAVADVKHFGLNADPPKKVCVFATLHYWIEQAGLVRWRSPGRGHQVELAYLPYAESESTHLQILICACSTSTVNRCLYPLAM